MMRRRIYTVGHSTRTIEEFTSLLQAYDIKLLADVRSFPGSRRYPHFGQEQLRQHLQNVGIEYHHAKRLGGRRVGSEDSINTGWRHKAFRGYADYMQTDEFWEALNEVIALAAEKATTIMCAEAVPWRCHRSLVGDALLVKDMEVLNIFDSRKAELKKLTDFAKVEGGRITYPPENEEVEPTLF